MFEPAFVSPLWNATLPSRFWKHVDATGDCWEWTAAKTRDGYGQIGLGGPGQKACGAHRVVWELLVGEIPEGFEIDHLCRNRACVNPDHLEPVTRAENLKRMTWSAPMAQAAKTHCSKGHPFSGDNLVIGKSGRRVCRACRNETSRAIRRRRRLEKKVWYAGHADE